MPAAQPLRVDAERNRARILDAARGAFAAQGLDVPMTEVARLADVGIATLYRRFPTADDLIAAVFADKMEAYATEAESALQVADPWTAFADYVRTVCGMQAADAGFADLLALSPRPAFSEQRSRAFRAFAKIAQRAKDTGALRSDFAHQDLVLLLMANAGLAHATGGNTRAWTRFTEYMLQAFRAPGLDTLPEAPSPRDVYEALQGTSSSTDNRSDVSLKG